MPWDSARELRRYDGIVALQCETRDGPRVALVSEAGGSRLVAIAEAHDRVTAPGIARVVERGSFDGTDYLLFDCDAVADLETVALELTSRKSKIPYPAAIAFNEFLMDNIESAHLAGAGSLGALGWCNILVGPSAKLWLFGLGDNFPARRADGSLRSGFGLIEAPELLVGSAATTASDVYLLHATLRGMLPYVELLPLFELALQRTDERSAAIYAALASLSAAALQPEPSERIATIADLRARYRAVRALAPEMPPQSEAELARVISDAMPRRTSSELLVVDPERRTFELAGERIELAERAIYWRMMWRLVEAHVDGSAVSVRDLGAAGWPDEKVLPEAARARVYVNISELRKTVLGRFIQKRADGYFLSPELQIQRIRL